MFQRETLLNQFFTEYLEQLSADVTADNLSSRPGGTIHTPLWILGHLAICGELGIKMVGGQITHRQWLPLFAPGTKDEFDSSDSFSRDEFLSCIKSSYAEMSTLANAATPELLDQPHGVELLSGSLVKTVGDIIAHLLTTHFAFHTAQLSQWRQASGHRHLF